MNYYRASMRKAVFYGLAFSFSQSIMFFANAATFYFGAWLILHDGLDYESLFKSVHVHLTIIIIIIILLTIPNYCLTD